MGEVLYLLREAYTDIWTKVPGWPALSRLSMGPFFVSCKVILTCWGALFGENSEHSFFIVICLFPDENVKSKKNYKWAHCHGIGTLII